MKLDTDMAVGDRSVTELVIDCLADATGRDPLELPPLWEVIDPDALNRLFVSTKTGGERVGSLTFTYCDHTVTIEKQSAVIVSAEPVSCQSSCHSAD